MRARHLDFNPVQQVTTQADFTYSIRPETISITDTGKRYRFAVYFWLIDTLINIAQFAVGKLIWLRMWCVSRREAAQRARLLE